MRIVIKPFGLVVIFCALVFLSALAFRPRGGGAPAASAVATPPADSQAAAAAAAIYDGKLENGWENYGWAKVLDWKDTAHARAGQAACIRAEPGGFEAVYFHHSAYSPAEFDRLTFFVNGGGQGGQVVRVNAVFPDSQAKKTVANATYGKTLAPLKAGQWVPVTIRLTDFGVRGRQKLIGFWVQNLSPNPAPAFYLDGVRFLRPGDPDPAAAH